MVVEPFSVLCLGNLTDIKKITYRPPLARRKGDDLNLLSRVSRSSGMFNSTHTDLRQCVARDVRGITSQWQCCNQEFPDNYEKLENVITVWC